MKFVGVVWGYLVGLLDVLFRYGGFWWVFLIVGGFWGVGGILYRVEGRKWL